MAIQHENQRSQELGVRSQDSEDRRQESASLLLSAVCCLPSAVCRLVVVMLTLAILVGISPVASSQTTIPEFTIKNESELLSVLTTVPHGTETTFTIVLLADVFLQTSTELEIPRGWNVTIDMQGFNFMGTGSLTIKPEDPVILGDPTLGAEPHITLKGSTGMFNSGLNVSGGIHLHYDGIYDAGQVDMFGAVLGKHPDNTDYIYFDHAYSDWNAKAPSTFYIDSLPNISATIGLPTYEADIPAYLMGNNTAGSGGTGVIYIPEGTIIVGWEGGAYLEISAGNKVTNTETILGAKVSSRATQGGAYNLYPAPDHDGSGGFHGQGGVIKLTANDDDDFGGAIWKGLGTFYIGYDGQGEVYIDKGAQLQVGSIELGRNVTGTGTGADPFIPAFGWLEVEGNGSVVTLFGRDDRVGGIEREASEGMGVMQISKGALVYFDSRETLDGKPSGFSPKITLGYDAITSTGTFKSTIDGAYIVGAAAGMIRDPNNYYNYIAEPYNQTKIGTANVYLQHLDKDIDGFEIVFVNSGTGREVSVAFDAGDHATSTPGTITVTRGSEATYDDLIAALNDIKSWETALTATVTNKGARPFEGGFKLLDSRGNPMNGSAILPITVTTMTLGTPTKVETNMIIGPTAANANSLIFTNGSVLQGSIQITMTETLFNGDSIIKPSFGSVYDEHLAFGRIDFTGDFYHGYTHDNTTGIPDKTSDAQTFMSFNVHGNEAINNTTYTWNAWENDVYLHRYQGDLGRDVLSVTDGTAYLAGKITFNPLSGYYADDIDIHFLQLDNASVNGNYDEMDFYPNRWFRTENGALFGLDIVGQNVINNVGDFVKDRGDGMHLILNRNKTPFTDAANTYNTRSVGGALNGIYNNQSRADWLPVLNWMWLMNDDELRRAMQQLAGETRASSFLMPVQSPWKFVFDRPNVGDAARCQREQKQRDCDPNVYYSYSEEGTSVQNGLWASPFYEYINASDDGNASASTNSRIGFMFGYDRALSNRSTLGFLFSYSHPELKQMYSKVKADDFLFGLHYDMSFQKKYELKLWGSYGTQSYRMDRFIPIPLADGHLKSSYTGNTVALSSQVAMPLRWREYVIRPLAALDLNYVQQNSATEEGYDAIRLHLHNSDWVQLFGRVGVKADYSYKRWDLNASLACSYLFAGDSAPTVRNQFVIDGPAFKIKGNDLDRYFLNFGLGGQHWLNEQQTRMCFLQYNGNYGCRSNVQTAALGCQFVF